MRDQNIQNASTIRNSLPINLSAPHRDFNDKWDDEEDRVEERSAEKVTDIMPVSLIRHSPPTARHYVAQNAAFVSIQRNQRACAACTLQRQQASGLKMRSRAHGFGIAGFPPAALSAPVMAMRCVR